MNLEHLKALVKFCLELDFQGNLSVEPKELSKLLSIIEIQGKALKEHSHDFKTLEGTIHPNWCKEALTAVDEILENK